MLLFFMLINTQKIISPLELVQTLLLEMHTEVSKRKNCYHKSFENKMFYVQVVENKDCLVNLKNMMCLYFKHNNVDLELYFNMVEHNILETDSCYMRSFIEKVIFSLNGKSNINLPVESLQFQDTFYSIQKNKCNMTSFLDTLIERNFSDRRICVAHSSPLNQLDCDAISSILSGYKLFEVSTLFILVLSPDVFSVDFDEFYKTKMENILKGSPWIYRKNKKIEPADFSLYRYYVPKPRSSNINYFEVQLRCDTPIEYKIFVIDCKEVGNEVILNYVIKDTIINIIYQQHSGTGINFNITFRSDDFLHRFTITHSLLGYHNLYNQNSGINVYLFEFVYSNETGTIYGESTEVCFAKNLDSNSEVFSEICTMLYPKYDHGKMRNIIACFFNITKFIRECPSILHNNLNITYPNLNTRILNFRYDICAGSMPINKKYQKSQRLFCKEKIDNTQKVLIEAGYAVNYNALNILDHNPLDSLFNSRKPQLVNGFRTIDEFDLIQNNPTDFKNSRVVGNFMLSKPGHRSDIYIYFKFDGIAEQVKRVKLNIFFKDAFLFQHHLSLELLNHKELLNDVNNIRRAYYLITYIVCYNDYSITKYTSSKDAREFAQSVFATRGFGFFFRDEINSVLKPCKLQINEFCAVIVEKLYSRALGFEFELKKELCDIKLPFIVFSESLILTDEVRLIFNALRNDLESNQ